MRRPASALGSGQPPLAAPLLAATPPHLTAFAQRNAELAAATHALHA